MSDDPARPAAAQAGRLEIDGVSKTFGDVVALADVSLGVGAGEFVTILGPSGSGKTTLLKVIAGFETAETGSIRVDGSEVTDLDPARRNIGMVFQNYALFPHLSVARNVGYPLAMRGMAKGELARRVADALEMVELGGMAERLPKQLSGGQQQRVALARATVFQPRLLLLDEPFGALDRKLRDQMQLEVRRLQRRLGLTTLFITHDQEEALIMSDRIAVMANGRLQQVGPPLEIYEAPANPFIADFIGESNIFSGLVEAGGEGVLSVRLDDGASIQVPSRFDLAARVGQRVRVMVRPERFVDLNVGSVPAMVNRIDGLVAESAYVGVSDKYRISTAAGLQVLVRLPSGPSSRRYRPGERICAGFHAADARLIEVE
ncbi:MAG TPA: ABC transporter ATP-binding protein [Hyphomicrobiaceae bacterium]|jgi:putative spermidine/putrescine transport system ATP-binding protein|nr:ABC transporter ATP-binding protein [Hyphomicrobiaceae bacterium]